MKHVGLLGGTFDPIHQGHITLIRSVMASEGLDGVLLIPNGNPPHKRAFASAQHRYTMCRIAASHDPRIQLSRVEMDSSVQHTTVSTLKKLRNAYPDTRFSFILGADKLLKLPYWKDAQTLFQLCDFLCHPRSGIDPAEALYIAQNAGARVKMLPLPVAPGTSALVRAQLWQDEDPADLDPDVAQYIAQNGLYHEDFLPLLRMMMGEKRMRHTLGVRDTAVYLARLHGISMQRAALAGLLHDCAKALPLAQMQAIAREHGITDDSELLSSPALLHGLVGAQVAIDRFHVHHPDVLNAIRYHTTGRAGMSPLELCIFVADYIEPTREPFPGLTQARDVAQISLPHAALMELYGTRDYLAAKGKEFSPLGRMTIEDLETILHKGRGSLHAVSPIKNMEEML